jgi:ATP-dependent DNA ligase
MKFLDQPRLAEPRLTHDQDQLPVALPCPLPAPHQHGHFLVGRREPIETRKSTLRSLLRGKHAGIVFNAHFIADGAIVYRQACALGCEGIVSKRLGSPYRSGRADCWLKVKNPNAPAVTREAEDWNS